MIYEYTFEAVQLSDEEKQAIQIGIGRIEELNEKIKETLNRQAKSGWEPLYPFSVPMLWFKRPLKKTRKN